MKEKLKKVFTNKEFWTALFGCLGLLLSIALSYFAGFKDGILLDNTIRSELIEKAVDDAKNNKKEKVELNFNGSPLTDLTNDKVSLINWWDFCTIVNSNRTSFYNSVSILGNSIYYLFSNTLENYNNETRVRSYFITSGIYNINSSSLSSGSCNIEYVDMSTTDGINYTYKSYGYICRIVSSGSSISNNFLASQPFYNFSNIVLDYSIFLQVGNALPLIESLYATDSVREAFLYDLAMNYKLTCSSLSIGDITEDDLENAYSSGYDTGFTDGYNDRKNSVEDTEQKVNSIWTILEKAITSVLNVLSFEILPGMPLYICIGVPILLAVLLWFIKMGQS